MTTETHLPELDGLPVFGVPPDDPATELPDPLSVARRISYGRRVAEKHRREKFDDFCRSVDTTRVRSLTVGRWADAFGCGPYEEVDAIVAAKDRLPAPRALFIGDGEAMRAPLHAALGAAGVEVDVSEVQDPEMWDNTEHRCTAVAE
ncbi:hypothetical protein [Streptomyces sp. DT171]|uniref:hypothetical protein n=1 Tax=Streptomyces sp. DT171 TaxID=3416524 RepID=UPI003CE9F854